MGDEINVVGAGVSNSRGEQGTVISQDELYITVDFGNRTAEYRLDVAVKNSLLQFDTISNEVVIEAVKARDNALQKNETEVYESDITKYMSSPKNKPQKLEYSFDVYNGTIYFCKYFPKSTGGLHNYSDTQRILRFKDGYREDIADFAHKIRLFLRDLDATSTKYVLCAAPSSNKDKRGAMLDCIDALLMNQKTRELQKEDGNNKILINGKDLFVRIKTVPKSALAAPGERPTFQMHCNTIVCSAQTLDEYKKDTLFILLDDILTKGDTLRACTKILLDKGIDKKHILRLALGKTCYE